MAQSPVRSGPRARRTTQALGARGDLPGRVPQPDQLAPGGGLPRREIGVDGEVPADERRAAFHHLEVDVERLEPDAAEDLVRTASTGDHDADLVTEHHAGEQAARAGREVLAVLGRIDVGEPHDNAALAGPDHQRVAAADLGDGADDLFGCGGDGAGRRDAAEGGRSDAHCESGTHVQSAPP